MLTLLLIFSTLSSTLLHCHGQTIINVANGVYSTKAESKGLHLSSTSTFQPIAPLTLSLYFSRSFSVFVNYHITLYSSASFWTKLQITQDGDSGLTNAGSLVHYGNQAYKTATGYWMENLKRGHYTFEVHYKSSSSISMSANSEQAAILQVMWFSSPYVVSAGVKCYPTSSRINRYNVFSPIKNLKVTLPPYGGRVVLAAYQLAIYSSSDEWFSARLHKNNQQITSTIMSQGDDYYFNVNGLCMEYERYGEYEYGITYRNRYASYFEDCRNNYQGNKNLYAMYLPSTCSAQANLRPSGSLSLSSTSWRTTDLSYSFRLYQATHIIVRYQYSTYSHSTYTLTRLVINSVPQPHTTAITGNTYYAGNSGMWQGVLSSGTHTISVQHRAGTTYTHYSGSSYYYTTRAMDIIRCS